MCEYTAKDCSIEVCWIFEWEECTNATCDMHPDLFGKWDKAFWARGYYVGTVGNVTEDAIKKYIAAQEIYAETEDQPKKNFF